MTVDEVRALVPEANVYCLDKESSYLIVLSKYSVSAKIAETLGTAVKTATGHAPIVLLVADPENTVRVLKVNG